MTDDQAVISVPRMPVVSRRMSRQGLTFTRAFVTTSRNTPPDGGLAQFRKGGWEHRNVVVRLGELGYRTALLGKYLNGYEQPEHVPPGWSEWAGLLGKGGYNGFNYVLSENGKPVFYGEAEEDYLTDVLADRAVSFIRESEEEDARPFFLLVSTIAPHSPRMFAPRDRREFKGVKAPRPPSFNEGDLSDKPRFVREKTDHDELIRSIDDVYRHYLRALLGVDRAVARILDALEDAGEIENTYVLFLSDNGYLLGEHRSVGKMLPYEGSIRIPLIIRGPGVPKGRATAAMALNLDLAPTFLEIAGAAADAGMDGRSLMPFLGGAEPEGWRSDFLIEHLDFQPKEGAAPQSLNPPPYRGLRTERYTYVEHLGRAEGERELYDLETDPHQLESLHDRPGMAGLMKRLSGRLRELEACRGEGCR
jgi:arylsulfatase A-like enzyme